MVEKTFKTKKKNFDKKNLLDELKKLSVKDRIKKLKDLEAEKKKELEETQKLINEVFTEVESINEEKKKILEETVEDDSLNDSLEDNINSIETLALNLPAKRPFKTALDIKKSIRVLKLPSYSFTERLQVFRNQLSRLE